MYLTRDKDLFVRSARLIYQYPAQIKRQWLQSIANESLRNIAANITSVSQERRLLRHWLQVHGRYMVNRINETSTLEAEKISIILFAEPLTKDKKMG